MMIHKLFGESEISNLMCTPKASLGFSELHASRLAAGDSCHWLSTASAMLPCKKQVGQRLVRNVSQHSPDGYTAPLHLSSSSICCTAHSEHGSKADACWVLWLKIAAAAAVLASRDDQEPCSFCGIPTLLRHGKEREAV